jgi:hypothetical protein
MLKKEKNVFSLQKAESISVQGFSQSLSIKTKPWSPIVCMIFSDYVLPYEKIVLTIPALELLRGRCNVHNFLRFLTIFGEKNLRFSQKPM